MASVMPPPFVRKHTGYAGWSPAAHAPQDLKYECENGFHCCKHAHLLCDPLPDSATSLLRSDAHASIMRTSWSVQLRQRPLCFRKHRSPSYQNAVDVKDKCRRTVPRFGAEVTAQPAEAARRRVGRRVSSSRGMTPSVCTPPHLTYCLQDRSESSRTARQYAGSECRTPIEAAQ